MCLIVHWFFIVDFVELKLRLRLRHGEELMLN